MSTTIARNTPSSTKCRAKDPATCKYHSNISKMEDAIDNWDFTAYEAARDNAFDALDTADKAAFARTIREDEGVARGVEIGRLDSLHAYQVAEKAKENRPSYQDLLNDPNMLVESALVAARESVAAEKNTLVDLQAKTYDRFFAQAPTYQKTAKVQARQVTEPTPITTVLADGTVETQNVAQPGDYIITNPGGEEYIISDTKFANRYRPTDVAGTFQAVGEILAIRNPTGRPITIIAPWGEEQHGAADCMLAASKDNPADRYIIGGAEFADTYALKA